jgi:hypothetical protein
MGMIAAAKKAHMLLREVRRTLRPVLLSTMPVCSCSDKNCSVSERTYIWDPNYCSVLFCSVK